VLYWAEATDGLPWWKVNGGWLRLYAVEGRGGSGVTDTDDQSIQLFFNNNQFKGDCVRQWSGRGNLRRIRIG
jgi:hypothetical protein